MEDFECEFILVADKTGSVIYTTTSQTLVFETAALIREGGGEVTAFGRLKEPAPRYAAKAKGE